MPKPPCPQTDRQTYIVKPVYNVTNNFVGRKGGGYNYLQHMQPKTYMVPVVCILDHTAQTQTSDKNAAQLRTTMDRDTLVTQALIGQYSCKTLHNWLDLVPHHFSV